MKDNEITARLADFIEKTNISDIPDTVIQKSKLLISDFLGVTAGGSVETPAKIIQEMIDEQGLIGPSTVMGTGLQAPPTWASLANGISGHALDFDDASQPMYGHPTTAVLPAILAVGEYLDISGMELLESYIIGVEVAVKLAYGMNPSHYEHGWHSTCTLGSMGSTAAVAKLMGLKGNKLRAALALGASQAGGLQQNFGTMIKPFHAGRAAENGVLAASLAKKGWTGDQNIMETPLGFLHIFCEGDEHTGEKCVNMLGNPYDIDHPGIILKKFPSCAFSHPVIDASLIIAQDPQYDPQKIEKVEGHIHALANQILIHKNPETGLEAKFSMEACSAFALVDGEVKSSSFSDDKVRGNEIKEMMARIEREIVPSPENGTTEFGPATVKVFLKDGKVMEVRVDKAKGNPANPMSDNEVREKYMDCCSGVLEDEAIEKSLTLLEELDALGKISQLMKCYKLS